MAAAPTNRCAAIRLDDREPFDIHGYPSASWTGTTFDPEMITQIQPRVESIPAFTVYEDGSRPFFGSPAPWTSTTTQRLLSAFSGVVSGTTSWPPRKSLPLK